MCNETATDLQALFEPVQVPTSEQDLSFDYVDATLLNAKSVYKKGNIIQFILPKDGLLIPDSARLFFNILFEGSDSVVRRYFVNYDMSTAFSRVTLTYGRTIILEDVQEYGQLSQIFSLYTESPLKTVTQSGALSGETLLSISTGLTDNAHIRPFVHNPAAQSATGFGQVPRRYMLKLNLGLFKQEKLIPLLYMNEELRLNFYLQDNPQKFGFYTLSGPSAPVTEFQLGRPTLRYKVYYPTLNLKTQIFNHIADDRFTLQWTAFQHQKFPLSSSQTSQTLIIKAFRKRVKYALAVIRSELDIDDPQADASATYVALDPRVPNPALSTAGNDQARMTTLKEYQWIYNNRSIPKNPVQVLGTNPAYPYTGGAPATPIYSPDTNFTSTGAEAFYYLQQTLNTDTGAFVKDFPWVTADSWITSGALPPVTTQLNQSTQVTERRAPCSFVIAGKFFDSITFPDGSKQETTIDCTSLNSNLQLKLLFNNRSGPGSGYSATYPNMYVDVWVAYNVVCQINDLGECIIEQ